MALMSFREPNQVKWVGVRPAHRGTQIKAGAAATNGATVIYAVPATKSFFLTCFFLSLSAQATGVISLLIRDAGGLGWATLARHYIVIATPHVGACHSLVFPIELPALYDFVVTSSAAGLTADALIFGWEE